MSQDIKCPCCDKKTIAKNQDGKIMVWCKSCKQEVEIEIKKGEESHEPDKV